LLDVLGQAVVAMDDQGRVTYWNAAAEALSGWGADDALGEDIISLGLPDFTSERGTDVLKHLLEGRPWTGGFTAQRKDGSTFAAIVTGTALRDDDGGVVGVLAVVTNIGQVLRPLLVHSREAAVVTTGAGVIQFAAPAVGPVVGWSESELAGRSLVDLVHPDDLGAVQDSVQVALERPTEAPAAEFRVRTRSGTWLWVEGLVSNLLEDASVRGLVWTVRDISERRAALEQMTDMALHDQLTGLPNRVLLADRLQQATSRRHPHGALLFLDLDGLKQVNDELGHAAGDEVLRAVADRLAHTVRPEDTCGRWAGDEFLVLNESVTRREEAAALVERLHAALAEPLDLGGRRLTTRVSIGVAMLDDDSHDPDRVLRLADEDMYRVKEEHRAAGTS
jgi:diguanylate cyclase (GGDEF)-like protein/PAS domain S-box-containing protein